jgi:phytoene dehydrogenase-like protein
MLDAIIVGAGHNGLVCACYLAQAGLKVLVLERCAIPGGAVVTEDDLFPGYHIDTCSTFHIVIHTTPIVQDLGLARFGLQYLEMDPFAFAPFPDGSCLHFYRDLDRTCAAIARLSPRDADAYRAFVRRWLPFNRAVFATFLALPSPGAMLGSILRRERGRLRSLVGLGKSADLLRVVMASYGQVVREHFTDERVRGALAWLAAQSGTGPDDPGGGELLTWQAIYHDIGVWRPRGGSGMLTRALVHCLEHHGGQVLTDAEVAQILVEDGQARGVILRNGQRFTAPRVIANAHVQTTLLDLVPPDQLPAPLRHRLQHLRVANGMGMTARYITDELPHYLSSIAPSPRSGEGVGGEVAHHGMQLLCPSLDYLARAYYQYQLGQTPDQPAVLAMTPTATDPSLAPPGKHLLYLWAQYHPYHLANGQNWDDIRAREAEKMLAVLATYAPNIKDAIRGVYIKSPMDLERSGGLRRGHLMHLDMTLDQMFIFRPLPELAQYRTPIAGLYLTGASTHPGGGVSGAPGYNTAHVVLHDLAQGQGRSAWAALGAGALGVGGALAVRKLMQRGRG